MIRLQENRLGFVHCPSYLYIYYAMPSIRIYSVIQRTTKFIRCAFCSEMTSQDVWSDWPYGVIYLPYVNHRPDCSFDQIERHWPSQSLLSVQVRVLGLR